MVHIDFLKYIPYYSGLSSAELESIRKLTIEKTVDKEEIILLEGESSEVLYFLVSGVVKVFKASAEGKEQILKIVSPGESLNDVPIFDGSPNPASAEAMTPTLLYGIRKNDILAILLDYPQTALNAVRVLASEVRHLASLVEDLSFRHVIARVAKILLEHAQDGPGPRPRLTHQEMASMAGAAREIIGRSLKILEQEGAIRLDRHRIVITDKEALGTMAGVVT